VAKSTLSFGSAARGIMIDRNNTIAGWVLFAGIIALGASIVTGEVFKSERPEKGGFPIEGVEVEG
jgi:cytochrome c